MIGTVYCVLFVGGMVKFGFTTGHPRKRVSQHVAAGKSFGLEVDLIMFTEPHTGARKTESYVISLASKRLKPNTVEYFSGANRKICRDIMLATGKLVGWADNIDARDDALVVASWKKEKADSSSNARKPIAELVEQLVKRNGVITEGVVKNRFRNHNLELVLSDLVSRGRLVVEETRHPTNRKVIRKYSVSCEVDRQEELS